MVASINDVFSLRSLFVAGVLSAIFYSLLFIASVSGGDKAIMQLEKKLSSQAIVLETPYKVIYTGI